MYIIIMTENILTKDLSTSKTTKDVYILIDECSSEWNSS